MRNDIYNSKFFILNKDQLRDINGGHSKWLKRFRDAALGYINDW